MSDKLDIDGALAALGATPSLLSPQECAAMDVDGYVLLRGAIPPRRLADMRMSYDEILAKEMERAGLDHHQEGGAERLGDLVNKGEAWDWAYLHDKFLALARYVIGDEFRLCGYSARAPLMGHGFQSYHRDFIRENDDHPHHSLSIVLMLDDFTLANGAIRLVPGTHRSSGIPSADPALNERRGTGSAGDVLVFNAHLIHGGADNKDGSRRRMAHIQYLRRHLPFWLPHQSDTILHKTYARLSTHARYILGLS
jgi:hypothetical protein